MESANGEASIVGQDEEGFVSIIALLVKMEAAEDGGDTLLRGRSNISLNR